MRKASLAIFCFLFMTLLCAASDVRIVHFDNDDGLDHNIVTCIIQDREGYIWLSSRDGLSRYDGYSFVNYKAQPGDGCPLESNRIDQIWELPDNNILCMSGHRTLNLAGCKYYVFNRKTGKFEVYRGKNLPGGSYYVADENVMRRISSLKEYEGLETRVMCEDRQGGYWVRTNRGIDRVTFVKEPLKNTKFSNFGEEVVRALHQDRAGRVWIADKNGFVRIVDRNLGNVRYLSADGRITPAAAVFGHNVYCIYEDRHGQIWLGTKPGGLFRLRRKGQGWVLDRYVSGGRKPFGINCNSVYAMAEDRYGRLWIGTYGGGLNVVERPEADMPRFINKDNVLSGYPRGALKVRCLMMTRSGVMLAGTGSGLYTCMLAGKPLRRLKFWRNVRNPHDPSSLSNNEVMALARDSRGRIYVATYGGGTNKILSRNLLSNNIRFKAYTTAQGLASDVNVSLAAWRGDKLWIVSEAGLTLFDTNRDVMINYMRGFFREGFAFMETMPLCLDNGYILFGTTQGVFGFSPSDVGKSNFVPRIVFGCDDYVELPADKKNFTIEFSALDYNKNEDIWYAYRMDGVDGEWIYTKSHSVSYAGIPPGTHTFRVRSTNGDGIWTDNERTVTIHRTPELTETPLAWMLFGGALLAALIVIYKVARYISRLRKEVNEITTVTNEKIEYLKNKVHELLTERRNMDVAEGEEAAAETTDSLFRNKAMGFINDNIANSDLSIDDFCKAMGMSRTVLYVRVKKVFGSSPNNFIQEIRIKKALALMKDPGVSISEVAYKCGFSDPKYFSRCFKKTMGCSPTEYMKRGETAEP